MIAKSDVFLADTDQLIPISNSNAKEICLDERRRRFQSRHSFGGGIGGGWWLEPTWNTSAD